MSFTIICNNCRSNETLIVFEDNGWVGEDREEYYIVCENCGQKEKIE